MYREVGKKNLAEIPTLASDMLIKQKPSAEHLALFYLRSGENAPSYFASSFRTIAAPAAKALSLAVETSRASGAMPQLVHG